MADDHNKNQQSENSADPTTSNKTISSGQKQRQEPGFNGFEDATLEDYEEPDRDTDFASGYGMEDMPYDEYSQDDAEQDYLEDDDSTSPSWGDEPGDYNENTVASDDLPGDEPPVKTASEEGLHATADAAPLSVLSSLQNSAREDAGDGWNEEEYYNEDKRGSSYWPITMLVVACIALALLVAGIFGVVQERSATQAELRDLRAELATRPTQGSAGTDSNTLRALQRSYDALAAESRTQKLENKNLRETVDELQLKLLDQNKKISEPMPGTAADRPVIEQKITKPLAAVVKPTPNPDPVLTNNWFVNFGSYTARSTAQGWASKLQPIKGRVVVVPSDINGTTLYRVRIVDLPEKNTANKVARQLEKALQVSRLWVGKQ